jgi:hypothetical protein
MYTSGFFSIYHWFAPQLTTERQKTSVPARKYFEFKAKAELELSL